MVKKENFGRVGRKLSRSSHGWRCWADIGGKDSGNDLKSTIRMDADHVCSSGSSGLHRWHGGRAEGIRTEPISVQIGRPGAWAFDPSQAAARKWVERDGSHAGSARSASGFRSIAGATDEAHRGSDQVASPTRLVASKSSASVAGYAARASRSSDALVHAVSQASS